MKNVSFILQKKLNGLFGQPNIWSTVDQGCELCAQLCHLIVYFIYLHCDIDINIFEQRRGPNNISSTRKIGKSDSWQQSSSPRTPCGY